MEISPVRYAQEETTDSRRQDYRTPHGERRTYLAGCKCERCVWAHTRYGKQRQLERDRGIRRRVPAAEVLAVADRLNALGYSDHAVAVAAGLSANTVWRLRNTQGLASVRTLDAVRRVGEVATGLVPADLTRRRIRSLMRAGWTLHALEERTPHTLEGGKWRYVDRLSTETAAAVRDLYRALEGIRGPSPVTAGKAKSYGYPLPGEWTDPGTLAWPPDWAEPERGPDVDPVAVERWLRGDDTVTLTDDEKTEAARLAHDYGVSHTQLSRRLRVSGTTLARIRAGRHRGSKRGPQRRAS